MKYDFTIFFTFYADGNIRRKYIEIALNTLFKGNKKDVPIIVVDASSRKNYLENKKLFSGMNNLQYIHDEDINPFTRCNKYLYLIKTDFVLRLLEDCAFIKIGEMNFKHIKNDIRLLKELININVVQYPIINEQEFSVKENTVFYPKIKFNEKKINEHNGYKYYNRSLERKINHYSCNNFLYRKEFFIRHWNYVTSNYADHSSAESGNIKNKFFRILSMNRILAKIIRTSVKFRERIFCPKSIIRNIIVSQTMITGDVIHIGYYSTETNLKNNVVRDKIINNELGVTSTLSNLKVFNDLELLDNINFERI